MKRPLYFLLFFSFFYIQVSAQTEITSNITSNTTWTISGSPYTINATGVTVEEGATLTIDAGVEVLFNNNNFHLWVEGTLEAHGTSNNMITFHAPEKPGEIFHGTLILNGGGANISYTNFNHVGPVQMPFFTDGLYNQITVLSGELNISNSIIRENIYGAGVGLGPNTIFTGTNNDFRNSNDLQPAYLTTPDVAGTIDISNNTYATGSGVILVNGETRDGEDLVWGYKEIPYATYVAQLINTNLTIQPGVTVKSYYGGYLYVQFGNLIAEGTSTEPIVFSGGFPDSNTGGIGLYIITDDQPEINHYFENCIFQQLDNCIFVYPLDFALPDSSFSVKSSIFDDIGENAITTYNAEPIIQGNCFSNIVSGDAILNGGVSFGYIVNANNNYWNHPTGPAHPVNYPDGQGEKISDGVIADFVLTECPSADFIDLSIGDLLSPNLSSCETGDNLPIKVRINNIGNTEQSGFGLELTINNGTPISVSPNLSVPGLGSVDYTFAQEIDIKYFEPNDIKVSLIYPADQNTNNNTATFFIESIPFDGQTQDTVEFCGNQINPFIEASGGSNYLWNTGSTFNFTYLFTPLQTADYYVTIANSEGCIDVDTVAVVVKTPPSVPTFFKSSNFLCFPNGTMTLTVPGLADNLIWSTGETGSSITINQAGYYSVTHVDGDGCSSFYQDYIYYESVPSISDDVILCNQSAVGIFAFAPLGSTYQWSNNETTSSISVSPMVTTTYSVTITTPNNCVHLRDATVTVASTAAPGTVSNMFPIDGTQDLALPVNFSWSPGDNATNYEVFIWEEGSTMPPFYAFTTTQISRDYSSNLQYGKTYNWKVCSRNSCSTADTVCSLVQQFTLNYLPDLIVPNDSITFSDTVFSGTEIEVAWKVLNQGVGSTQAVSANGQWRDAVYLSTDMTLSNDDRFLGSENNPLALVSGQGYNSSFKFMLPNGIEGDFFLIVCTDRFFDIPESDETNNCGIAALSITIQLSPFPDLEVTTLPPIGGGGTILAGSTYDLQWTVANQMNGINSGPTRSGKWYDRIHITTEPECNGTLNNNLIHLATVEHQGNLEVGASYIGTTNITIPNYLEDTVYLCVCTDVYDDEYEYVFESNNCQISEPLFIPIEPKPDFRIIDITVPDTASNKEIISLTWTGKNEGAEFVESFTDRVYITDNPSLPNTYQNLGGTSQNFTNNPLGTDEFYNGESDVRMPSAGNGKFYIVVVADAYNDITEKDETNNNIVDSIIIISPNLIVSDIPKVPDAFSGQTVTINWAIENIGPGDLFSSSITDRVRLVNVDDPLDFTTLISSGNNLSLFSNNSLTRALNYNIPNGFTGKFCLEVTTNYNQNAYENGMYSDNTLIQCDTFEILSSDYPNLVASSVESPFATATAGEEIEVEFIVNNNGDAPTSNFWSDRIYLSTNDFYTPGTAIFLKTESQSQIIPSGEGYEKKVTARLPYHLQAGTYYFHLITDSSNSVFETNETDNQTVSTNTIEISVYPAVDLQFVGQPIGPNTLTPGESATVSFEIKNEGTVITPASTWRDALYLSPNPTWEPSDFLLSEWQRNGALNAGESYARQESFILPVGFTDVFYLCLVIDHENAVDENNENNNYVKILQQSSDTIIIVYLPNPDLTIDACTVSNSLNAGQPVLVDYDIRNSSTVGDARGTWKESFYLSTDEIISPGDIALGQKNHTGGLLANEIYKDSIELTIPLGVFGNYFLLMKTDGGHNIIEEEETNNVKSEYVFITQPTPSDLIVVSEKIIAPPIDTIATDITIGWTTKNIGQNPISGYMEEGVYLSLDTIWDASDILLDTWKGSIGLDPNTSVEHELTARLENVRSQNYYVFVKTDLLDHFLENEEDNNCSISGNTVFIEIPELPIGLPTTLAELEYEQAIYYRIEIPTDTIGETMRVSISSSDDSAFNELYIRHNDIPSRTVHDYTFSAPFEPNQKIIIPAVDGGTYYMMAYAVDGMPIQDVELLAEIIPFQITSIQADEGGNTGSMTAVLEGAKFKTDMTVHLEKEGLPTIIATQVNLVNGSKAFVTFPLAGASIGLYDVVAVVPTDQDTLVDGFEVVTGSIGNETLQTNCSFNFNPQSIVLTNLPPGVEVVDLNIEHLPFIRPNQTVAITIQIKNTGDIDVPAPSRIFDSLNGFPLSMSVTEINNDIDYLPLSFEEKSGPPDILRPGGIATIIIYSKANQDKNEMKFKLISN